MLSRAEATELVLDAKLRRAMSFEELARVAGRYEVWVATALLGQATMSPEEARAVTAALGLDGDVAAALAQIPSRGAFQGEVPVDPLLYRLFEIIQVFGPAVKAVINERFGDGIMSAIDFELGIVRKPDPKGDRVVITLDGKFLPYRKSGGGRAGDIAAPKTGVEVAAKAGGVAREGDHLRAFAGQRQDRCRRTEQERLTRRPALAHEEDRADRPSAGSDRRPRARRVEGTDRQLLAQQGGAVEVGVEARHHRTGVLAVASEDELLPPDEAGAGVELDGGPEAVVAAAGGDDGLGKPFQGRSGRHRSIHRDLRPVSYTHLTLPTKRIV